MYTYSKYFQLMLLRGLCFKRKFEEEDEVWLSCVNKGARSRSLVVKPRFQGGLVI